MIFKHPDKGCFINLFSDMQKTLYLGFLGIMLLLFMGQGCQTVRPVGSQQSSGGLQAINSFEECVTAGNLVMESYPRQCQTADGTRFVEDVEVVPEDGSVINTAPEDTGLETSVGIQPTILPSTDISSNPQPIVELQDNMAADIDNINFGEDAYSDTSYFYEEEYVDPNACSTEGASYSANDTTYYCVDGIWTMSDYVYPYQDEN